MRFPDFLVIGGMRCGTTSLYELLRQQSGIYLPEKKELHFFDRRNPQLDRDERYAEVFAPARDDQLCGEVTPDYLTTMDCDQAIHALIPEVKLIAVLRDPVARVWSHYQFSRFHKVETEGLGKALDLEEERLALATDHTDIFFSYQQRGRYIEHLLRYESLFGREQMHVMFLDDLRTNTHETVAKMLRFLGGDELQLSDVGAFPSVNRITAYQALEDLAQGKQGRSLWQRLRAGVSRKPVTMPPEVHERLQQYFQPYNQDLERWMGRPLAW